MVKISKRASACDDFRSFASEAETIPAPAMTDDDADTVIAIVLADDLAALTDAVRS